MDLGTEILCIKDGKIVKSIGGVFIKNGFIYKKAQACIDQKKTISYMNEYGEGDEYNNYETFLYPMLNGQKLTDEEKKIVPTLNGKQVIDFVGNRTDIILKLGFREEDGMNIMTKDDYINSKENTLDGIRIVEEYSQGNLLFGTHLVLSKRVSKDNWNKIKHCFKYTNTKEFNDEVWGSSFIGYEIKDGMVEEVEKILGIPSELSYATFLENREIHKKQREEFEKKKEEFLNELSDEFSTKHSCDISEDLKEYREDGKQIKLEGERISLYEEDIYGNGHWFIVQENYIWNVYNNGSDGSDWSRNFIFTGGAGAYGFKLEKTEKRMKLLEKIKDFF